jgi:hypothetical protein
MERFDKASSADAAPASEPTPQATPISHTNGHSSPIHANTITIEPATRVKVEKPIKSETPVSTPSSASLESDSDLDSPPKKNIKRTPKPMDDAQLAAMLQAQENSRTRATRGGGTKRKTVVKKAKRPKKKSADKVKADDDSDLELDSQGEVKEKVRKGGFHKQYHLSAPLADLVGESMVRFLLFFYWVFGVGLYDEIGLIRVVVETAGCEEDLGAYQG